MRRILIERARQRATLKRGGDRARLNLDEADGAITDTDDAASAMLELDAALAELEANDARMAEVVKLRYFIGLSVEECGAALSRSPRSIKRDWAFARAWLTRRLAEMQSNEAQVLVRTQDKDQTQPQAEPNDGTQPEDRS
jgi:RNA polymerase sigma factor (TIGR02999 family)